MSRWLKSVNNLLENLDGQAENVDIDGTIGQLIEKGQQVAKTLQGDDSFDTDSQGEEFLDEEDDYGDDDDMDYDIDVTARGFYHSSLEDSDEVRRKGVEQGDSGIEDEFDKFGWGANETSDRQVSIPADVGGELLSCAEKSEKTYNEAELNEKPFDNDKIPDQPSRAKANREEIASSTHILPPATVTKISSESQPREVDVSPRPPKRSVAGDGIKQPCGENQPEAETSIEEAYSKDNNSREPKAPHISPTTQSSISLVKSRPLPPVPASNLDTKHNKSQLAANPEVRKLTARLQSMQEKLAMTSRELKATQVENQKLDKHVVSLNAQLDAANSEIHAQSEELRRAGERMEKDRRLAQEEREELLDDQDEEIEQLKVLHTSEVDVLKKNYEKQLRDLTTRLESEVARRAQEGGNWNKEYDEAVKREREALENLTDANVTKSNLELDLSKLEAKVKELESKLESATLCTKEAEKRQQEAEDKLDAALSQHARQLGQRQSREAELEQTIFDLGSALTEAKRTQNSSAMHSSETQPSDGSNFKDKYKAAAEESETLRVQLNMETQRRKALEHELNEMSKERSEEISVAQAKQLQQDRKVADLETTIAQLKSSLHALEIAGSESISAENNRKNAVSDAEIEEARNEIAKLSDQLMRHQRIAESSKSEILALKGRLHSATSRAEAAERSLLTVQSSSEFPSRRSFDVENVGFSSSQRRVKGARRRPVSVGRTIRASLNLDHGPLSNILEQVVSTIDALDKWMVDTGGLMRNEPLARLGFLVYLVTLHLWTFGLVVFHTVETPHGDFGTMDTNPRHWRNHS